MDAPELEALLTAHAYLRVERPPALWTTGVDLEAFLPLLGEMIAAGLVRNGQALGEITLNVSNVSVEPDDESHVPPGDFVAFTIRSRGDWAPEATWSPGATTPTPFVSADLAAAAARAGAAYGYTRTLALDQGSVTVFLPRARA
jgi:hypothetical protein